VGRIPKSESRDAVQKARGRPSVEGTEGGGSGVTSTSCVGASVLGEKGEGVGRVLDAMSGGAVSNARGRPTVEGTEGAGPGVPSTSCAGASVLGERWGRLGGGTQEVPPKGPSGDSLGGSVLGERWGRLGGGNTLPNRSVGWAEGGGMEGACAGDRSGGLMEPVEEWGPMPEGAGLREVRWAMQVKGGGALCG